MKTEFTWVNTAPQGVNTSLFPRRLIADWQGLMEPARSDCCPK